jgi:prophage maintenance system killer protein
MITLNKQQIEQLHTMLLDSTGGLSGIRDAALLDSALATPFQTLSKLILRMMMLFELVWNLHRVE